MFSSIQVGKKSTDCILFHSQTIFCTLAGHDSVYIPRYLVCARVRTFFVAAISRKRLNRFGVRLFRQNKATLLKSCTVRRFFFYIETINYRVKNVLRREIPLCSVGPAGGISRKIYHAVFGGQFMRYSLTLEISTARKEGLPSRGGGGSPPQKKKPPPR